MDKLQVLQQFPLFSQAPESLQREIFSAASPASLEPGACYFHPGDRCGGVPLVGAGSIRVFMVGDTGREITLYHVEPGQSCLLSLHSALCGSSYPAEAVVEETVAACLLPTPAFRGWIDRHPVLRRFIFDSMSRRIRELMILVTEVAFGRLDQRVAQLLALHFESSPGTGTLHTTHERIAAELGSSREVISRILKEFERQGAVKLLRGQIRLRDRGVLSSLAGQPGS